MIKATGKISVFGGPSDTGVGPAEGLAIFEPSQVWECPEIFLGYQPEGTVGLARRLDPDSLYVAGRWDYNVTPKAILRCSVVKLTGPNGATIYARPADWGPHERTGRVWDISPQAAKLLDVVTDDVITGELLLGQKGASTPSEPEIKPPTAPIGSSFVVGDDHWLVGVKRSPLPGRGAMNIRRCVVEHFTDGATAQSSIDYAKSMGLSAHIFIDRDGTVIQCVPFNQMAYHAGASAWIDPKTRKRYTGANSFAIGIEIANGGYDDPGNDAYDWAAKQPGFECVDMKHRNGGPMRSWEVFYAMQIASVLGVTKALVERYRLDDVTGHDCIAPKRKTDPGPAFPMQMVREYCGFEGLPEVVH
jgi:N-acetylmuramoyl-L-alanine amidase